MLCSMARFLATARILALRHVCVRTHAPAAQTGPQRRQIKKNRVGQKTIINGALPEGQPARLVSRQENTMHTCPSVSGAWRGRSFEDTAWPRMRILFAAVFLPAAVLVAGSYNHSS